MKDKKELSKVISALTDAVNALNTFVADDEEEIAEPVAPIEEVPAEPVEPVAEIPAEEPTEENASEEDDEMIEIIDDDEAGEAEEEVKEEDVSESEKDKEEVEEGIIGTGLKLAGAGAALGAGAAIGNKLTKKLIGEEAEDNVLDRYKDDEDIPCMCDLCGWEGYIKKADYDGCCPHCHEHCGGFGPVEEGLLDIVKAPVKAVGSVVSGIGNALTGLGEECEECEECDEGCKKDEGLLGTAAITGLVGGAAGAVGKKIANKVLGEDAEEDPEIAPTTGEQVKQVGKLVTDYFKDSREPNDKKAQIASAVVDAVPADLIDDAIRIVKDKVGNMQINDKMDDEFKKQGVDSTAFDKVSDFIDGVLENDKTNKTAKALVTTIVGIIALVEPTPAGEIITAILALIPGEHFLKLLLTAAGLSSPLLMIPTVMYWVNKFKKQQQVKEEFEDDEDDDDEVAIEFDDGVSFDECVNENVDLVEAKLADFEDKFGFYVSSRIAEDVFYRDAYILVEPTEAAAAGCEVIYVDADQMIYLYNEGTDRDEYSHYVHSDIDVKAEIRHILQTQLELAFDEIANVRVVKGKYYR